MEQQDLILRIEEGVKRIEEGAYDCRRDIVSVLFPASLEEIGPNAFRECDRLKTVVFPAKLKKIGARAFNGCSALTEVALPSGLEEIGRGAFCRCYALRSLSLPSSVRSIDGFFVGYGEEYADVLMEKEDTIPYELRPHELEGGAYLGEKGKPNVAYLYNVSMRGEVRIQDGTKFVLDIYGNAVNGAATITKIHLPKSVELLGTSILLGPLRSGGERVEKPTIVYEGAIAEWNALAKTQAFLHTVHARVECVDGTVDFHP